MYREPTDRSELYWVVKDGEKQIVGTKKGVEGNISFYREYWPNHTWTIEKA